MELDLSSERFAICRLEPQTPVPRWATDPDDFVSVTRTRSELTVVVREGAVPADVDAERGWRALAVRGPLDLSLTGVLASLAGPLALAGIPIFAISTYDTDWLLVREVDLDDAVHALGQGGHTVDV